MISVKRKYLSSEQSSFDLRRYWKALDFDECALHFKKVLGNVKGNFSFATPVAHMCLIMFFF